MFSLELHSTSTFPLVSPSYSSFSDIYHTPPYIFLCSWLLLATSSIIFHLSLCPATGISYYNWIISTLNSSSFGIYTFPFFNINSLSICYSSPHNIFTPTFFISSTTLTTSLSLLLAFFIFSTISTSGSSITTSCKL